MQPLLRMLRQLTDGLHKVTKSILNEQGTESDHELVRLKFQLQRLKASITQGINDTAVGSKRSPVIMVELITGTKYRANMVIHLPKKEEYVIVVSDVPGGESVVVADWQVVYIAYDMSGNGTSSTYQEYITNAALGA